jgi:hypothetical protein
VSIEAADYAFAAVYERALMDGAEARAEETLAVYAKAWAVFESLAPSRRKQYIAFLVSAKRPETKAKRVARAIDMLERGEHPMDKYRRRDK